MDLASIDYLVVTWPEAIGVECGQKKLIGITNLSDV